MTWIGVVGLYMAVLGVFLSLGVLAGISITSSAACRTEGIQYNNLYYFVVVDFYTAPAAGGVVTRPDGVDACPDGTLYQSPTVSGGTGYYTGTRQPTMAVGFATAPLNFWATAEPAPGYQFDHWQGFGYKEEWCSGNQIHVQYDEPNCDLNAGYFQITAVFTKKSIQIDFRSQSGIVYDSGSGLQSYPPDGVVPVQCHVASAYTGDFEFAGWIGSESARIELGDQSAEWTYLDMQGLGWLDPWATQQHWLQPTLRPKAVTEDVLSWSLDPPTGEGLLMNNESTDNQTLSIGELYHHGWVQGASDYEFRVWELTNVGCSDIYSYQAMFWLLTDAPGSAVGKLYDPGTTPDIWTLTMAKVGSGNTSPALGDTYVLSSVTTSIRAVPSSGWYFSQWQGLPNGRQSSYAQEAIKLTENTTVTAVFLVNPGGGGGGDGGGGAAVVTGIWGGISNTLFSVGLGNAMGRMMVVLAGMVVAAVVCGKNKTMRVVAPLGVLGIGIIGLWVPIWIVILLAIGVGVGILGWFGKRTAA